MMALVTRVYWKTEKQELLGGRSIHKSSLLVFLASIVSPQSSIPIFYIKLKLIHSIKFLLKAFSFLPRLFFRPWLVCYSFRPLFLFFSVGISPYLSVLFFCKDSFPFLFLSQSKIYSLQGEMTIDQNSNVTSPTELMRQGNYRYWNQL